MSRNKNQFRMRLDFVQEIISVDEDKGLLLARLIPDPRRYEWRMVEGKKCLYDRLDDTLFSEEVIFDLAKQMVGKPVYFQPQEIDNSEQYVKSRIPLIKARLKGDEKVPVLEDKSEAFLESLDGDELAFVIMCVDMAGSTKLSTSIQPRKYTKLISTMLYEVSEIIPRFHGHVLKYTGDGLIAYFPEPSFITKNDLAIDCALTIRRLLYSGLNPVFEESGYPSIDIRIGLDSGEASVVIIGSPKTKQHSDIIGAVVNLAAKIQGLGGPGDILLGDVTLRNLHTMWRGICEPVELPESWEYKAAGREPYRIHRVIFGHRTTPSK
jgi:adenylate cyclase